MSGRMRLFWLVFAVVFAAAAVFACFYAGLFGTVYNRPGGNPQETVQNFFESIKNGDYSSAYACLADYTSLGLETEPETAEAKALYSALKQSYGYVITGESTIEALNAVQTVRFRALNIRRAEDAISQRVNETLEELVAELPPEQVYAAEGGYLPGLTDLVYSTALERVLQNPDPLCSETGLTVHLQFRNGQWLILSDRSLQNALMGGES